MKIECDFSIKSFPTTNLSREGGGVYLPWVGGAPPFGMRK